MKMTARRRPLLVLTLAGAVSLALVGCANDDPQPAPSSSPSSTPSPSASATPGPTPDASESPAPVDEATAVSVTCDTVITADELYQFNPNFALVTDRSPEPGSFAAMAVEAKGIACHYMNLSSNEIITLGVASPGQTTLNSVRADLVKSAEPAEGYGGEGWYGDNTAVVIRGNHLVSLVSPTFFAAGDAAPLLSVVMAKLP